MADHAQILRIKKERPPLILIHRQILPRPRLLDHRVIPAAGVGAFAPVGVPPRKIVAQQAASRIGNAHRPVNEALDLPVRRDLRADPRDLRKAQLPRRHHALRPQPVPEPEGGVVRAVGLRADMHVRPRQDLARQREDTRIGDDQRVHAHVPEFPEIRFHAFQISVAGKYIRRHIDFYAVRVGQTHPLFHLLQREIPRLRPKTIGFAADIDRVRAVADRRFQHLQAARRRQQFDLTHRPNFPSSPPPPRRRRPARRLPEAARNA